jgi:energy-coupling factor transporter ATP-binding protein EcfA2
MLEGMSVRGWRQFDEVRLLFHPRITVLTGSNGSGKSTLLRYLELQGTIEEPAVLSRDLSGRRIYQVPMRKSAGLVSEELLGTGATFFGLIEYKDGSVGIGFQLNDSEYVIPSPTYKVNAYSTLVDRPPTILFPADRPGEFV